MSSHSDKCLRHAPPSPYGASTAKTSISTSNASSFRTRLPSLLVENMSMSTNSHDNHIDLPDFSAEPEDHSFSDDLQALHDHEGDITLQKRKAKVVIQHRSWPLAHSFRSDDDRSLGERFHTRSA